MTALLTSLWAPGSSLPWQMLDKNNPPGAFLFDFRRPTILSGVVLSALRKIRVRSEGVSGLPKQDWPVLFLLGGIVVIGFILEGMRIAMDRIAARTRIRFSWDMLSAVCLRIIQRCREYTDTSGTCTRS